MRSRVPFDEAHVVLACTAAGALVAFSLGTSVAVGTGLGALVAFAVVAAQTQRKRPA